MTRICGWATILTVGLVSQAMADTVTLKGTAGKVDLSLGGNLTTTNSAGTAYNYPSATTSPTYTYYVDSDASSSASNTLWDLDLGTGQLYYLINGKAFHIYAASITNSATGTIYIWSNSNGASPLNLYTTGSTYLTSLVSDYTHINGACASVTINSGSSVTITDQIKTEKVSTTSKTYVDAGNITVTATTGDITIGDILARCVCGTAIDNNDGGDIALTALQGDVVVTGAIDAYAIDSTRIGDLTISATNGTITLADLDVGLVRNISLKAQTGTTVSITNLITGLTVDNVAGKVKGPFLVTTTSNNITYHSALQTTLGLKGNYNIYQLNGTTDVGYDLIDLDPDLPGVGAVGLSGNAGTTSADVVASLNVPTPAGANYLEIFYDTTDHTNDVALWQPRTVVGSYLSVTNLFVTNTVTATELAPNMTYYYRFALSNAVTGDRTWQRQASRGFVTDGAVETVKLTAAATLDSPSQNGVITTTNELRHASYVYSRTPDADPAAVDYYIDSSASIVSSNKLWNLDLGNYDISSSDISRAIKLYAASVTSGVGRISMTVNRPLYLTTTGPIFLPEILCTTVNRDTSIASVTLSGSAVTITNKVITGTTTLRLDYGNCGNINITATTGDITVKDLLAQNHIQKGAEGKAGSITNTAMNGNVVVTGQINAYSINTPTKNGNLTITAGGDITLSSLNVTNLNTITFTAGGKIQITGDIVGLTVAGSTVTLPNGRTFTPNKDIFYDYRKNTAGLVGTYAIGTTGKFLKDIVPRGTLIMFQ